MRLFAPQATTCSYITPRRLECSRSAPHNPRLTARPSRHRVARLAARCCWMGKRTCCHMLPQARQLVLNQRECGLKAILFYLGADVRCADTACSLSVVAACFQTAVCAKEASMAASPSFCPLCLQRKKATLALGASHEFFPPGCRASAKALSATCRASNCRPQPSRAATSAMLVCWSVRGGLPARAHQRQLRQGRRPRGLQCDGQRKGARPLLQACRVSQIA